MAYPLAAGVRNIGSDAMRYIPVIYSGKVQSEYRARTILTQITNTDYEGEIKKYGDSVWIRTDPIITVRDYRKGQNLVNEQPESTAQQLLIDQGKYWSFCVLLTWTRRRPISKIVWVAGRLLVLTRSPRPLTPKYSRL